MHPTGYACTHAMSVWGNLIEEAIVLQDPGQDTHQYGNDAFPMAA